MFFPGCRPVRLWTLLRSVMDFAEVMIISVAVCNVKCDNGTPPPQGHLACYVQPRNVGQECINNAVFREVLHGTGSVQTGSE